MPTARLFVPQVGHHQRVIAVLQSDGDVGARTGLNLKEECGLFFAFGRARALAYPPSLGNEGLHRPTAITSDGQPGRPRFASEDPSSGNFGELRLAHVGDDGGDAADAQDGRDHYRGDAASADPEATPGLINPGITRRDDTTRVVQLAADHHVADATYRSTHTPV